MPIEFHNDDEGFIRWRDTHPDGRILSGRSTKPHRTTCLHIAVGFSAPFSWTRNVKRCYATRAELEVWAHAERVALGSCATCGS